jgi:NAD(P)H-quinone oxidoreductase subunit 5
MDASPDQALRPPAVGRASAPACLPAPPAGPSAHAGRAGALAGHLLLGGLAALAAAALAAQTVAPAPVRGCGLTVDRLSAALTLLVAGIGLAAFRFSVRHLDGDPRRGRFLGWLAFTVTAAYGLMLATHLLLLAAAWSLTSVGLHHLLTHYADRPEAVRAARKKFLISRLGDVALAGAAAVVWRGWGTFDLHALPAGAAAAGPAAVTAVALLAVAAAVTKSAQFPFHSWLPETMEAPAPVSALMHAGVINAGGALLLRFAPVVGQSPPALLALAAVGTATLALGTVAMWAQVKVKRTLAWSTVAQMGFMMAQCGVGAFAAAAAHIVAHGCYKAWSFLRAGDVGPPPAAPPAGPGRTLAAAAAGVAVSLPAMAGAAAVTGFSPVHSPGELALAGVVALSAGQVWAAVLRGPGRPAARLATALVATAAGVVALFALYRAADVFLGPVLAAAPAPGGPAAWAAAGLPVAALLLLTVVHAAWPALGQTAAGRAFRVHALHGFYAGVVADRVVAAVWARLFKGK